jgi:hydroxyacylglutathione hydrolase
MHTPGHTPESITFLVRDTKIPSTPERAITGDFIFVGNVGRPDLLEKAAGHIGSQEIEAKQLFKSIQKFSKLSDDLEIWPGHGAGSFCGKSLSTIPQSTLKEEKIHNKAFHFSNNEKGFIAYILDGQPTPPKYFAIMKHLNKTNRPLLVQVPIHPTLNQTDFQKAIDNNLLIIDTRKKEQIAKGYLPNSLHIENGKSLSTWIGSLVNYELQIVLITDESQKEDLTRKLMRIGMDNIYGFVTDLDKMNIPLKQINYVSIDELKNHLVKKDAQIIDVRTESEYKNGHIEGVKNFVLTSIENNLDKINKHKPVIVHCQSGARAAIAHSILQKSGFNNILIYSGEINEWTNTENELVEMK